VHHVVEQGRIFATHIAGCDEASGIKLICHQDIVKVLAECLKPGVVTEVGWELFFAVASNTPLRRDENSALVLLAHQRQVDLAGLLVSQWWMESG